MMCNTCGHEHVSTEQVVRYQRPLHWPASQLWPGAVKYEDVVEETMMVCSEPGCLCSELSPTSYEDRVALIQAGEISP